MTRSIAVITGTRAEYGLLEPVSDAMQDHAVGCILTVEVQVGV